VKRPRLVFVHQTGSLGGAGIMLANILSALGEDDAFDRVVVCPKGPVRAVFTRLGVPVIEPPGPIRQLTHISGYSRFVLHPGFVRDAVLAWVSARRWRSFLARLKPDIVHLNSLVLLPLAPAARASGAKVVCLVQETAARGLAGVRFQWFRRSLSRWADAALFISQYDRDVFRPASGMVDVIPNWVNESLFDARMSREASRAELGIAPGARVVLFVGGISPLKGTLPLLQAVARLADVPDIVVLIAGHSGRPDMSQLSLLQRTHVALRRRLGLDYHDRVMRVLRETGIEPRVRFMGVVENPGPLYAASDVVVFPATAPHQARPVLEAGVMRRAVVVSAYANLAESVVHERNGLLVTPRDVDALAGALRRVLTDHDLRDRLAAANRSMMEQRMQGDSPAERMRTVYRRLSAT
jgi:glycosyltransferase involved in cell wall biosynthesis